MASSLPVWNGRDVSIEADEVRMREMGEPWWSSYRYQLEAFVNKVKGRTPHVWVTKEESIKTIEIIESVYAKVHFPNVTVCISTRI